MVKHIVMWKVEASQGKTKQEIVEAIKEKLEGLKGQIEGLVDIEVGINYNTSDAAYDVVLNSVFKDNKALNDYQGHEKHLFVANTYVRPFTVSRVVVDYEI